ncbi:MAG TPA: hypothetical protein VFB59_02010 [Candidatus Saccharimonadales bacterium]|nr:hypothetical protein [Candidatus Saccharimonadales bacterium]
MDKKALHYFWLRIRPVHTFYFFVAFLVAASICVVALRGNYQKMVNLREAVYAADQAGVDVESALANLRAHVNGHMNTDLTGGTEGIYPPIHLKGTYERLVQAEQERVNTVNSKVYSDAQAHCEALYPTSFSGGPRVPCIEQYVKEHGTTKQEIPVALYKFDFASPTWSPDLAGWMLVTSALLLGLAVIRFLAGRWLSGL